MLYMKTVQFAKNRKAVQHDIQHRSKRQGGGIYHTNGNCSGRTMVRPRLCSI